MMITVNVAKDFTRFPSGRFRKNGDTSGQAFREIYLEPHLKVGEKVSVELDGTIGYGSSFLEEAFGGLVRSLRLKPAVLNSNLLIKTEDTALLDEVNGYMEEAAQKLN
jgi:STAS-like domain of unknown function (DUF4325)